MTTMTRSRGATGWAVATFAGLAYLAGAGCLAYLAGFLVDVAVPRDVDGPVPAGDAVDVLPAVARDLGLVLLFGASHSLLARPWARAALARVVPAAAVRSLYVLVAAVTLGAAMAWWTPLPAVLWRVDGPVRVLLLGGYAAGWVLALAATFAVSHTDLFGLRQAASALTGRPYTPPALDRRGLYRRVRHPLMTGLLVALWVTPVMTAGHALFALAMTGYVLVGVAFEERDLLAEHGPAYAAYRRATPAFVPWRHPARRPQEGPRAPSASS